VSFLPEASAPVEFRAGRDDALLHRMGCKACPLAKETANLHPYMDATGAKKPVVYMLGEAPGKTEDEQGRQFVGDSGKILRPLIPDRFQKLVRWNNSVNCHPKHNRTPVRVELECCRSRVTIDIEDSQPRAILGFGNVPLEWATGQSGVTLWRGRRLPVKIGSHVCWFFPMLHPAYLLRNRRGNGKASDDERIFELDVERAFAAIDTLPPPHVHSAAEVRAGCDIISEGGTEGLRQIRELLEWAAEQPVVGVDYETDRTRPYRKGARILSAAVGTGERAVAFPFEHPDAPWSDHELGQVADMWCDFLRAPRVKRAVHNLAFELEWTGEIFGAEYVRAGLWEDTANQAAILDERHRKMTRGPFSLDWLVTQYFGFHLKSLFPALDRSKLADYPLETVLSYNAPDAKYHALLYGAQEARLSEEGLEEPYRLACRRVPTVVLSQLRGAPVDQAAVRALKAKYDPIVETLEDKIAALPVVQDFEKEKGEFNPLSNPNVHHVFVDMLKRPECRVVDKYTKKEKFSADESILSKIDHPLSQLILDLRSTRKQISTYIDPLLDGSPILYDDGCLHTNFNTFLTDTGRLSSDGPNVQNFPKRDGDAAEVRRPIAAPPGCMILAFDYGQLEARVIAMLTKDPRFVKALWENYDVHMEWAERIARAYPRRIGGREMLTDKKAMKDFRTDIKNQWTFPLFFGARLSSAAGYLNIPEDAIADLYEDFWEEFSGVAKWQKRLLADYQAKGYVECATGRRRRGPLSLNKIINTPVQGTAAEVVMDCMSRLSETGDPDLQPELNIHDDFTFLRVPENRVDDVAEKILNHMLDTPFPWARNVPIAVDMSCGKNWMPYDKIINPDGLQEVGKYSSDKWFA
jgi:uracil-DNA glycosylase family 4